MKRIDSYFLILVVTLAFSCQKDESTDSSNFNKSQEGFGKIEKTETDIITYLEQAPQGTFFSKFNPNEKLEQNEIDLTRCSSSPGSNNLDLCGYSSLMGSINIQTSWNVLDNPAGFIDYELEELFSYSCDFSYTCIRPAGPPVQVMYGEVEFHESPSYNYQNGLYDIYYYLGSNSDISINNANELKEHFMCKIDEFRDANLANSYVSEVNFYGDILLCGSATRYLKAYFKLEKFNPK